VKMVKDPPQEVESQPIDYREIARVATRSVSTCIAVYVTADTVRRAVIYAISAKF
jgi:hypothetical protein